MDTKELVDKATQGLADKPASKGKKKIRMTISPTDNAGYFVEHSEDEEGMPSKKASHVFEQLSGVHQHMDKTYGKAGTSWENKRSDKEAMPEGKPAAPKEPKKD